MVSEPAAPHPAVVAFSQGEKIKSGCLWVNHCIELLPGLLETDGSGALRIIKVFLQMIAQDVRMTARLFPDDPWDKIARHIDMAFVMVNSGVASEAPWHLAKAVHLTSTISHRSLARIQELMPAD